MQSRDSSATMKLLILCCVLSTALAVPVRRSLASKERLPILISQGTPLLPRLTGFMQWPQMQGFVPFTQQAVPAAVPQQAAQYAPWWNGNFPELYQNFYGFPVGGMPPPVGGMPPPVGGMPPPVGGRPPAVGK
ncbi:elastin-like isoform X2 [Sphaerodactylus townsendi]|uniref:elastin-like isoform X2 n=1 Tax=Sphaerodactylus townsendi TaxID=933632 RepID=UPI002026EEA6|nr:elastin-like isoform X2 [Sphaerodactylus townsendi]